MNSKTISSYGAKSTIFISFQGSLIELSEILEKFLDVKIRIENEEYSPFSEIAYTEALGFEAYIAKQANEYFPEYNYVFTMETMDSFEEIKNNQIYDLSIWFARYVAIYGLKTLSIYDDNHAITFTKDLNTQKIEQRIISN